MPGTWKVTTNHRHYSGTASVPMAHIDHRYVLLEKNGLIVADVFSKYFIVRKLPNSTSAAVCAELSMIVTELGLPHISQVIMAHATIPKSSSNFCNVTTSHTKPAAQTIPDLMDLLREWRELPRS